MIDLHDIQSLIVRPSRHESMTVTFVRFQSQRAMRAFLAAAAECVTTAADAAEQSANSRDLATVTVAVTAAGLDLAGLEPRARAALPAAFLAGMRSAARRLGDVGESDPTRWHPPFDAQGDLRMARPIHAVVIVHGDLSAGRKAQVRLMLHSGESVSEPTAQPDDEGVAEAETMGDTSTGDDFGWVGTRRDGFEPFGFRDNISDPVIEGSGKPMTPGNGVWDEKAGRWRPVRAGEAILGYVDESGSIAGHADAAHIERNGSYLVMRKLEQDVDRFWRECEAWATDLGVPEPPPDTATNPSESEPAVSDDPAWARAVAARATPAGVVAAQMVGRAWNGTPLGRTSPKDNDFLYRDRDRARGMEVSPTAHIRRANPRDGIAKASDLVPRHLLFRRGIPYLDETTFDGTVRAERPARGLLFLACCADLHRQFEFVQSRWLQDGSRFGLGRERDPLTGTRHAKPQPPLDAPPPDPDFPDQGDIADVGEIDPMASFDHEGQRCRGPLATFVSTRGGEYFLIPGRSALLLLGDAERSAG